MKIALLAVLGLILGTVGGGLLGLGAALAWAGIFQSFGSPGGMLLFVSLMPAGAVIGGLGGAVLFARKAIRSAERTSVGRHDG